MNIQFINTATQFLREVRAELTKVVWPGWNELVGSTGVVIMIVAAFSLYLGGVDYLLSKVAELVLFRYGIQ